jgi:hypothetical protein
MRDWLAWWQVAGSVSVAVIGAWIRHRRMLTHDARHLQIAQRIRKRWHVEMELLTTAQDRDYYKNRSEFYRAKCLELMAEAKDQASFASSLESSIDSSETPVHVPSHQLRTMPTSPRNLKKRKGILPTRDE